MVELGWTTLEVTQEHMQNLMSEGYMTAVELATYHMPKDPASPHSGGRIHHGVHGILRARIWCAIALISPLSAAILWHGTASLDRLKDLAHGGLCFPM
jgi:hypothetical protein